MKKLKIFIALLMLISINIMAQDKFISVVNSSSTALDSSATFTGKAEDVTNYGSIIVTYKSDKASATSGVKFQFSSNATNWDSYLIKTYVAADSLTNTTILPVKARYFRIVYTNTTSAQTYFRLQTIFSKNVAAGVVEITGTVPLPTGASTAANQVTQISRATADSLNLVAMKTRLDSITADLATTKARADSIASSNTQLLAKNDSLKAKINLTNAAIATLQDTLKQKITMTNLALAQVNDTLKTFKQIAATQSSLLVLLGYQHPFSISTGTLTTVSTEVDTTTFTSTVWQTFGAFAVNDTLEISLNGSFTDAKIVYPYTAYTFEKFSPTTFAKGYIRRYGGAGTVSYIPTIKGF